MSESKRAVWLDQEIYEKLSILSEASGIPESELLGELIERCATAAGVTEADLVLKRLTEEA